jgi:hypothetical protein
MCDKCSTIKHIDNIVGIALSQDVHDVLRSFPIANADLCQVHVCTECYTEWVDIAAGRLASRKNNEEKYQSVRRELSYTLRKSLVLKVLKPDLTTKRKGKSLRVSS